MKHIFFAMIMLLTCAGNIQVQASQNIDTRGSAFVVGAAAGVINGLLNRIPVAPENEHGQLGLNVMSMFASHSLYYKVFSGMNNVVALWSHGFAQLITDSYNEQDRKIKITELNATLKLALLALICNY